MSIDQVLSRLAQVRPAGNDRWAARCPAHEDSTPSLSIAIGEGGRVLLHCHAGCNVDEITAAAGLAVRDLAPEGKPQKRHVVAIYDYVDEAGELVFQKVRFEPKGFSQRRPDPAAPGRWVWNVAGVREDLIYRLPAVLEAVRVGEDVWIAEGEKDCDALVKAGVCATTNPGGAGKWRSTMNRYLAGARVVIVADRDEQGQRHAADVAAQLAGTAKSVRVVEAATGKDAADHLAAGHSLHDFRVVESGAGKLGGPEQAVRVPGTIAECAGLHAMLGLSEALTAVQQAIRRFVVITDHQAVACTLWVAQTYVLEHADTTPYLSVTSPEKQSGKSRLLDVLQLLVNRPWRAVLPSEAVVYRKIAKDTPTLLLDEVDAIFGPAAKEHEGLRAMLNAGFRRRGSTVPRCVWPSMNVEDFPTFCPKALAGIGRLPDTVADRAIPIQIAKKRRTERIDRLREKTAPTIVEDVRVGLVEALMDVEFGEPELPDELDDRAQDAWEILLAIADAAGGQWPEAARDAAVNLSAGRSASADLGNRLLADIHLAWVEAGADVVRLSTTALIDALVAMEDAPWADYSKGRPITGKRLANLLEPYGIEPGRDRKSRGYRRADFEDAWSRYVTQSVTSVTDRMVEPKTSDFKASRNALSVTHRNGDIPLNQADVTLVTLRNAPDGQKSVLAAAREDVEATARALQAAAATNAGDPGEAASYPETAGRLLKLIEDGTDPGAAEMIAEIREQVEGRLR